MRHASPRVPTVGGMKRFGIDIPPDRLDDLRGRPARTRWPDGLDGVGWSYGVPPEAVRGLGAYWADGYDWRAHEARLNELPQYLTVIDGQRVHFAHVRSADPDALPLMLVHGWPSTFADFSHVAGLLREHFHLVIPSIPGFAFSAPVREPGWGVRRVAGAFGELMARLGYERYGVQGGDFGSLIAPAMGRLAPDRVAGVHVNALTTFVTDDMAGLTEAEIERAKGVERWEEVSGYAMIQGTRPQTLAYGLTDSPAGLLGWYLDAFEDFGRDTGAVARDDILTDVSITWFTGTGGSAGRLYKESSAEWDTPAEPARTPTGVAVFPGDSTVRRYAEQAHHVVHWTEFPEGGHYAALRSPRELAADVTAFFAGLA